MCDDGKFGSLNSVCDVDKFERLEAYTLCVMLISLEVREFGIWKVTHFV